MSKTKTLKELLDNAIELTSISSTDRLAIITGDGKFKKIGKGNAFPTSKSLDVSSPQWVRLFSINAAGSIVFEVSTNYNSSYPNTYIVQCLFDSTSACAMKVVSSIHLGSSRQISKLRLVKISTTYYVDAYYTQNTLNAMRIVCFPSYRIMTPIMEGQAILPAGATLKEFTLAEIGGG